MANPNTDFNGDIFATTLQGYSGQMADNITNHNALLRQLKKKGNKRKATGRSIVQEIEYAENSTVQWYSGSEQFDVSPSDTFTAAEFNYKQLIGVATINGLEQIQNSGKEAVHNLYRSRIKNLEKSLTNTTAAAIYADGTGNDGKEIGGLQLLVADVNTNTVGGISASANTWWKNYVYDFSDNSVTPSKDTILHAMTTTWLNVIRGADKPDIIVADMIYYQYYWESLTPNQRFTDDKGAGAGFTNLVFQGSVPVVFDDQCPASHMYFLNTDYLFIRPAMGTSGLDEYTVMGERAPVNQDAMVRPVKWAGNMTVSNRARQGVICA